MQYIGPSEVELTKIAEVKTPLGYDVLEVKFKDGTSRLMSQKAFDKLVTEQATDLTELRDRMTKMIVGELLVVLAEWNPKIEDIANVLDRTRKSVNENLDEADAMLYGVDYIYNRTMLHVHKVLINQNAQHRENNNTQANPAN